MVRSPSVWRPLGILLSGALIAGTLLGAITPIFAADPPDTYYVAHTTASGTGVAGGSCSDPAFATEDSFAAYTSDDQAIQAAIDLATDGDIIVICTGTYEIGATLDLGGKLLSLQGVGADLSGIGADTTVLDGMDTTDPDVHTDGHQIITSTVQPLVLGDPTTLGDISISGMILQNGYSYGGGAISGATVTVSESSFEGNTAGDQGGAIVASSTVNISMSVFTGNYSHAGGAITSYGSTTITGSYFTLNSVSGAADTSSGGVLNIAGGVVRISGSTFKHNTSEGPGGVLSGASELFITTSSFEANESAMYGGAVDAGAVTAVSSSFTNNTSAGDGGAIYAGVAEITSSSFTGNYALDGGAIYGVDSPDYSISVASSSFLNNTAEDDGGAISAGTISATSSTFTHNVATTGGGGAIHATLSVEITDGTFSSNTANDALSGLGGAIFAGFSATARIYSSSFTNNTALDAGAILAINATIDSSAFMGNVAVEDGGAVATRVAAIAGSSFINNSGGHGGAVFVISGGALTVENSAFANNYASADAGAIHAAASGDTSAAIRGTTFYGNTTALSGDGKSIDIASGSVCGVAPGEVGGSYTPCDLTQGLYDGSTWFVSADLSLPVGNGTSCDQPDEVGTTDVEIQAAIDAATDGDRIVLCPGTYDISTTLDFGFKPLTLQGAGAGLTILDGGNGFDGGASLDNGHQILWGVVGINVFDMTLQNGYVADGSGAAINSSGTVNVIASIFTTNTASDNGGAVIANDLVASGSIWTGNATHIAAGGGVGVFNAATVTSSAFVDNSSELSGGAIAALGDTKIVTVASSVFSNNAAINASGGGISSDEMTASASAFETNSAGGNGGAIIASHLSAVASSFTSNSGVEGGGIEIGTGGSADIAASSFTLNTGYGGGLDVNGDGNVAASTFLQNSAAGGNDGGGIWALSSLSVSASAFDSNAADGANGGAIYSSAAPRILASTFTSNTALYGGAIYTPDTSGVLAVTAGSFESNSASDGATDGVGGAVNAITAVIGATAFGNNSAYVNGAAVEAARGAVCGVPDAELHGGVGCSMSYQAQAGATLFVAQTGTADVPGGTSCALPNFVGATDAAIQDAIEVASDGDTIVICSGTYDIGTTLNLGVKPLTLQGAGSAAT
ncbi:MAG: hypothetical protein WCP38_01885, partial [Chloroflexota bacterium]